MNSIITDPDVKINMSLDEIIRLTKEELNAQLPGKGIKQRRKRKNNARSIENYSVASGCEVGNDLGVDDFQNVEERKRFIQAVSNRGFNSELLQKSKEIIPAEYKLIKTSNGVERVLVPVLEYYKKPNKPKQRKIHDSQNNLSVGWDDNDKPPPLMSTLILDPPLKQEKNNNMEVDGSDDEIREVCVAEKRKNLPVIDLESDLPVDVVEAKRMCVVPSTGPEMKTLSDRFTMLTGSFQF